jgi:putative addiction module component (TIGR02574 family)
MDFFLGQPRCVFKGLADVLRTLLKARTSFYHETCPGSNLRSRSTQGRNLGSFISGNCVVQSSQLREGHSRGRKVVGMLKADELINEAISLPMELRARLVDELLKSLNPSQAEIDELWAAEAERRIGEIESGKVKPIPGEQVFKELRKRLGR